MKIKLPKLQLIVPCILLSIISSVVFAQYPAPAPEDTTKYGRGVQRTMQLLASSTPTNKKTVKILVYGQSISKQEWWEMLRDSLKAKYPNANLIMENKAIGGFASSYLIKPMYQDVLPYNPDLVLFHVYGSQFPYDTILRDISTYTTAEIAIQADHVTSDTEDSWTAYMNYNFLPGEAQKYKAEMMQIRPAYFQYLADVHKSAPQLTIDGTHLNEEGKFLLAALIQRHLAYKPKFTTDPRNLVKTYEVGKDISFTDGKISLQFVGNRIEFIADNASKSNAVLDVTIDGQKPSSFPGTYFYTRANDSSLVAGYFERSYNDRRIDWPWPVGTTVKIQGTTNVAEDWIATISDFKKTDSLCQFNIALKGSVTGDDGGGSVTMVKNTTDANNFFGWLGTSPTIISNSKKIIINSKDWWIPQAIENLNVKINSGYQIKWSSIAMNQDQYGKPVIADPNLEYVTTIAHGIPNENHTLEITGGSAGSALKTIRVYSPYYNRPEAVTAVNTEEKFSSITVYPNPANQVISIDLRDYSDNNVEIKLVNAMGKIFGSFKKDSSHPDKMQLSVADMEAGLYFLNIEIDGEVTTKKIIVFK